MMRAICIGTDGLGGMYLQGGWPTDVVAVPEVLTLFGVSIDNPLTGRIVFDLDNGRGVYEVIRAQPHQWTLQLRAAVIWWPFQKPEHFNA